MFRRFGKKRVVVALSAVGALALAISAYAYFTSSGSGTGSATVGSAQALSVSVGDRVGDPSGGPLYPDGTSSETLGYTVTNNASFAQSIGSTTVTVVEDANHDAMHGATSITGCKASWFSATDTGHSAAPATLDANGGSATGIVTVTMPANSTDNQDACQGKTPDIKVSANAS
jgi:hypothetical protein